MTVELSNLRGLVYDSKEQAYSEALDEIWAADPDYEAVLDAVESAAFGAFSHRFSTIHVPKEHEYLHRFLGIVPEDQQLDFLRRYLEYLVWSPKYLSDSPMGHASGVGVPNPSSSFLDSAENSMALRALFYINEVADDNLEKATRLMLRVGCADVSQAIGHYYSCTESVVKLTKRAGLPAARTHLFTATLYLMQSSPMKLTDPEEPLMELGEILSALIHKSGFAEYHYMIVANGLIKQRGFLGETHYLNGVAGVERLLPRLRDGMSSDYIDRIVGGSRPEVVTVESLKEAIWKGDKAGAFAVLRAYLSEHGITDDLKRGILHSYTLIDEHPHDPHYVTVPVSIFEMLGELKPGEVELALAHTVEFAVDRVRRSGTMGIRKI